MIVSALQKPKQGEIPYATDDNLLERAEQLFDAGHPVPAAMTARVQLERRLKGLCQQVDHSFKLDPGGVHAAVSSLRRYGLVTRNFATQIGKAIGTANAAAHGRLVTLQEVDRLLSATRIVDDALKGTKLESLVLDQNLDSIYRHCGPGDSDETVPVDLQIRLELGLARTKLDRVHHGDPQATHIEVPCLSVRQPWAQLIIDEKKPIENRTWRTKYRGPLAIHASTTLSKFKRDREVLKSMGIGTPQRTRFGFILGVVRLVDVVHYDDLPPHSALRKSPLITGPWCWILDNAWKTCGDEQDIRGRLGLFPVRICAAHLKRKSDNAAKKMKAPK